MKKFYNISLLLFLLLIFISCESMPQKKYKGFHVEGTTLYDKNGNPFVMRGINHMHTWFPYNIESSLKAIAKSGSNCVRLVLSNGVQWKKTSLNEIKNIISLCKENNLIAILEVHDTTGKWKPVDLVSAAQYFIDIKEALLGEEAYVILNIANEWPSNNDSGTWQAAYEVVLPLIRKAGLNHTIMVDCAGGGQFGKCLEDEGLKVLQADPLKNTMFSIHMYGTAGGSPEIIEKNIKYATDNNLCICVGEFGFYHSDGDVDEEYIMKYCQDNQIGYIAWSWKGNADGLLDMAKSWDGNLTDWGKSVFFGENGIKATSEPCSIFK